MSERVSAEEVGRVAALASLELEPGEIARMQRDLNAILDYVAQLNELDTAGVAALAQVSELLGGEGNPSLRGDEPSPSLDRAAVMAGAPETDGVFFKVPRVIER